MLIVKGVFEGGSGNITWMFLLPSPSGVTKTTPLS
ncbi:MAG: hypothetical protein UU98_C0007G0053 [Parcubacteria group bacterium GW2011_GWD2_42_14]|nr:MAG: hypothetical protein UU98_C0007G0053 [Parcubacteria group bacterium GW2011_GWD2_42_14]